MALKRALMSLPELQRQALHNRCGWSGLTLGLIALALALLPAWIAPLYDPPSTPLPPRAVDWLSELKDKAAAAIRMEPPPPPAPERRSLWRDPHIGVFALVL